MEHQEPENGKEKRYLTGHGGHSARGSGTRDFQSCTNLVLCICSIELDQDHNPYTPSRPFMPETALICSVGSCACPPGLQDDRRKISGYPIRTNRNERNVWFLHTTDIISGEIGDSCSNFLVLPFKKITFYTYLGMVSRPWLHQLHH